MRAISVRQALKIAADRGCSLEAVRPKTIKKKTAAAKYVPRGGLLVHDGDGYVPLALVPNGGLR